MKNHLKKLLCMLMVVSVVFTLFVPAIASFDTATAIVMDKAYSDSVSKKDNEDYFKFTTTAYGRVRIYFSASMKPYTVAIYDSAKKEVKSWVVTRSTASSGVVVYSHALDAGTYFIKVSGKGTGLITSSGNYSFRTTFTTETKVPANVDPDDNNAIDKAKKVYFNTINTGKILKDAKDKENDYYVFEVANAGSVTLKMTSYMEYYCVYLLNANGKSMWSSENNKWDADKKQRSDEYKFELSPGNYYIRVNSLKANRYPHNRTAAKGNYEFELAFTSAGITSAEPNDSIIIPNKLAANQKVVGHLSMTDRADYYEFTALEGKEMIAFVSNMSSYNIRVLDADNKEVWSSKDNKLDKDATSRSDAHNLDLAAGRYFLVVDGGTGKYSFTLSEAVTVGKVKTIKYSQTVTTLKLKWSKVSGADGYEVFEYDEEKKEYVQVGATTGRSLKLKKLVGGTDYTFKVRAYKKVNGCNVYGDFSGEKLTTTYPARVDITGIEAGEKSATVSWKSVTGASGYRVFYTSDPDFDYAKKIVVNDAKATSKKVEKLKSGKKYYFRVRAYKVFKGKNVYGNLSKINSVKVK